MFKESERNCERGVFFIIVSIISNRFQVSMPSTTISFSSQDRSLRRAVEGVVDRLSILQTSVIDDALLERRAPNKDGEIFNVSRKSGQTEWADTSALEPVDPQMIRSENEKARAVFSGKSPSSQFLAAQLLADYRGEIAACVTSTPTSSDWKEGETDPPTREYLVLNALSDDQCRIFKKSLKKRIHQFEATVTKETGESNVRAARKVPLRALYELYSVSKNRLEHCEKGKKPKITTTNVQAAPARGSARSFDGSSVVNGRSSADGFRSSLWSNSSGFSNEPDDSSLVTPSVGHSSSLTTTIASGAAATSSLVEGTSAASTRTHSVTSESLPVTETRNADKSDGGDEDGEGGVATTSTTLTRQEEDEKIETIIRRLPRVHLGTAAVETMSMQDLAAEKHYIKQSLSRYENEVLTIFGRSPIRHSAPRRRLYSVYKRYGALKVEIRRRSGGTPTGSSSTGENGGGKESGELKGEGKLSA